MPQRVKTEEFTEIIETVSKKINFSGTVDSLTENGSKIYLKISIFRVDQVSRVFCCNIDLDKLYNFMEYSERKE